MVGGGTGRRGGRGNQSGGKIKGKKQQKILETLTHYSPCNLTLLVSQARNEQKPGLDYSRAVDWFPWSAL